MNKLIKYPLTVLIGLVTAVVVFVFYLVFLQPPFYFPKPTGRYAVGSKNYHLVDTSRKEPFTDDSAHPNRELMIKIWYPAAGQMSENASAQYARYVADYMKNNQKLIWLTSWARPIYTHAQPDGQLATDASQFPVIIFSHGYGGTRDSNTAQCEELASHGYIIVGISHTYESCIVNFPDGRIADGIKSMNNRMPMDFDQELEIWISDVQFVLDQLEKLTNGNESFFYKRMDLKNIGVLGHSYGGATMTQVCRRDSRIKAGVNLDGPLYGPNSTEKFDKPFMFMLASNTIEAVERQWTRADQVAFGIYSRFTESMYKSRYMPVIKELAQALNHDVYTFVIDGAGHMAFSDRVLVKQASLFSRFKGNFGTGSINGFRAAEIVNAYLLNFFNKHLKKQQSDLLDGSIKLYDEVEIMPNVISFFDEKLRNKIFTIDQLRLLTKTDIEFVTKTIIENHPGPYNKLDPEFTKILNLAHQEALDSIHNVKILEDHNEIMQKYVKRFHDSHLNISTEVKLKNAPKDFYQMKNFNLKEFMPNVVWVTIPTFDLNNQQQDDLNKILTELPGYRDNKLIIFDLRGNTGGDSYWGTKILRALFGDDYTNEKISIMDKNVYVDWRVSKDNLAYLSDLVKNLKKEFGDNSESVIQRQKLHDEMATYLQKNIPLLSERDETNTIYKNNSNLCHANIIVLTDKSTGSASLRFIDELKSLNHPIKLFGQTTGADSLYMQAKAVALPSKLGHLNIPMKVYRNRPRKNNEPYKPDIEFTGDIKNTPEVEKWVKKELDL